MPSERPLEADKAISALLSMVVSTCVMWGGIMRRSVLGEKSEKI